jgi:hypothetical protein
MAQLERNAATARPQILRTVSTARTIRSFSYERTMASDPVTKSVYRSRSCVSIAAGSAASRRTSGQAAGFSGRKASRVASREGRPAESQEKCRVASDRGGLMATAGSVALPKASLLSCADAATTLTAAAAKAYRVDAMFFRPADVGSQSEMPFCRALRCLPRFSRPKAGRDAASRPEGLRYLISFKDPSTFLVQREDEQVAGVL